MSPLDILEIRVLIIILGGFDPLFRLISRKWRYAYQDACRQNIIIYGKLPPFKLLCGVNLTGMDFYNVLCSDSPSFILNNVNFRGANLSGTRFKGFIFKHINFEGTTLLGTKFVDVSIEHCLFTKAALSKACIDTAVISHCSFSHALLDMGMFMHHVDCIKCDFIQANMSNLVCYTARFVACSFNKANLSQSKFCDTEWNHDNETYCELDNKCDMTFADYEQRCMYGSLGYGTRRKIIDIVPINLVLKNSFVGTIFNDTILDGILDREFPFSLPNGLIKGFNPIAQLVKRNH